MWLADLALLCLLPLLPLLPGCWPLSITEFQVPEFVGYGHVAQLKCKYDLSENESDRSLFVKWWWSPLNSSSEDRSQLYQRIAGYEAEAIPDNVEIDVDDGIILLNVTAKDSGIYECEVSNLDEEVRRHQKLIVYSMGSGPLLNVSLSEDETEVEVTCEALDVAPYPDISISLNGETVESTEYVSDPVDGLYHIVENATLTLMEADGKTFGCAILFKEGFTPPAFVASEIFYAPTVSTTEAAEDAATAIEDSSETSQPDVSGSIMFGGSWAMLATAVLWLCCTANLLILYR